MVISSSGCATDAGRNDEEDRPKKSKTQKIEKESDQKTKQKTTGVGSDYERLVICGFEMPEDKYFIKSKGSDDYLFIESSTFEFSFKIPYIPNPSPDVNWQKDGKISIVWTDDKEFYLHVDIAESSDKAVINGSEYDLGIAPVTQNGALYIPVNLFIPLLEMEIKQDKKLDAVIIDRKEDFPKEILLGTWSDVDTNLFIGYKDIVTGVVSTPSFAESYSFNEDGTFRLIMVSMSSFRDGFLYHEGKYKIYGNTIVCYDIFETLYEGKPFQLVHENKRLDYPRFEYIENYNPNEEKIKFTFWLHKLK
jgi:hypothetical protein